MFAEYVQGNIDDASCLFDAANHDAERQAIKKQAYLLILRRFNKYKTMICIYHGSTIILTVHIMPYTIRKVRGRPCYRVTPKHILNADLRSASVNVARHCYFATDKTPFISNKSPKAIYGYINGSLKVQRCKNRRTKRVFAKCTSKKNAKAQIKLLHAIDYNPKFQLRAAS